MRAFQIACLNGNTRAGWLYHPIELWVLVGACLGWAAPWKSSEFDKKPGACGAYAILCCPHEWLLIASRPAQGLLGPAKQNPFRSRLPLASAGAWNWLFAGAGQPGSALSSFRWRWGCHNGLLWCENFPGGGRRPGIPVRSEMSQPDSDGLDLSYRITPEYMSRCSQIHTGTRLTKLTSISTYYCSTYCCFCFPTPSLHYKSYKPWPPQDI